MQNHCNSQDSDKKMHFSRSPNKSAYSQEVKLVKTKHHCSVPRNCYKYRVCFLIFKVFPQFYVLITEMLDVQCHHGILLKWYQYQDSFNTNPSPVKLQSFYFSL